MRWMIYFPNDETFLTSLDNAITKDFFFQIFNAAVYGLGMMKTQTSYFAEKRPLDGNGM